MNSTLETHCSHKQDITLTASMPPLLHDSLTTLIQRVYVSSHGSPVHTVVVTSVQPRSGVSYLSSCLSTLLAETFGSTLLLDGQALVDLAHRRVLPMRSDCTAIRHSKLSVLGRTQAANLVRHADDNASDISFVLDSLLHDFEYIIVDAPALPASKTAQTLSPNVDGVLLVVVPNETDIGDICAARKTLVSAGAQLLGAIYNTILDHSATTLGHTPCSDPSN